VDSTKILDSGHYDFLDFGCSNGGSLKYGLEVMGAKRGIGIDLDERKVQSTRAAGYEAICADAAALVSNVGAVSFALMFHFLEHLPGQRTATSCIRSACLAARDFVLIRQPWFDSDAWLFANGLKLYWSDWHGHSNKMGLLEFQRAIRDANVPCRYRLYGRKPIRTSDAAAVHPVGAPKDQQKYQAELHGTKPSIEIGSPTFHEVACIILRSEHLSFPDVEKYLNDSMLLFEAP